MAPPLAAAGLFEAVTKPVRDGEPPVLAEPARRDPYSHRSLAALVFTQAHEAHNALDVGALVAPGDDLPWALIALDVRRHDRVEHRIGRQAVLVGLVGPQLGRRRAVDHALRYHGREPVAIAREAVDHLLVEVLQHREPARHVPVEGRVAGAHLALVPRGEN